MEHNIFSEKIENGKINFFSTPHIVIDNIFTAELAKSINEKWPINGFQNEVKGNRILPITRHKYQNGAIEHCDFWSNFNESIWPRLMSTIANKFEPYGKHIFGDLYATKISLDHPLTLMEANEEFDGHDMHTHFYHAPHWVFTVLIYIDDIDNLSEGTTLHALNPLNSNTNYSLSCLKNELQRSSEIAFNTFRWLDPKKTLIDYNHLEIDYKFNRLLCFMDGPLSLHSVKKYSTINEKRELITKFKINSRRRILRSHVKIHHEPFYKYYSNLLGVEINPEFFMRAMAFDPELSNDELIFKNTFLFQVYKDMVRKHSMLDDINYFSERNLKDFSIISNIKKVFHSMGMSESRDRYLAGFLNKIP